MMRVASLPPDTIDPRGPKANERHRLPPLVPGSASTASCA